MGANTKSLTLQENATLYETILKGSIPGLPPKPTKTAPDSSPSSLANNSPCEVPSGISGEPLDKDEDVSPKDLRSGIHFNP